MISSSRTFIVLFFSVAALPLGLGIRSKPVKAHVSSSQERFSPPKTSKVDSHAVLTGPYPRRSFMSRHIDKIFEEADSSKDGSVEIAEIYTLVLKMYVLVNRQAPIKPPTWAKVKSLFDTADSDKNGRLSLDEFRRLMRVIYSRASTRIIAHKIVKLIIAPILALSTFKVLARKPEIKDILAKFPEKHRDLVSNANLWRTALVVLYVSFLGNIAPSIVDFFLDRIHLSRKEKK